MKFNKIHFRLGVPVFEDLEYTDTKEYKVLRMIESALIRREVWANDALFITFSDKQWQRGKLLFYDKLIARLTIYFYSL